MKNKYFLLICLMLFHFIQGYSQHGVIPRKSENSVLFGQDVVIRDSSSLNQRQVTICSAFNGWLFAEYMYHDLFNNAAATVMKSIDNGVTWTQFFNGVFGGSVSFNSLEMIVTGDSIANLKVFLAFVPTTATNPLTGFGPAYVWRYNGVTGDFEDGLLEDFPVSCLALCSDIMYPAINSNPQSIGILYSKKVGSIDSLIFRTSSNGGTSLGSYQGIASQGMRFHKVGLTYGRSASWNSGRYYAVWESKTDLSEKTGHIYIAHTEPNINSPFTTPIMLDSIDVSAYDNARNPTIACQYNSTDNDSSNITAVVLFEKYIPAGNKYDIDGFYNLKSTNTNHFKQFNLDSSSDNKQQPSVCFNPFDSKFLVTYYDSTTQKLPFLLNNFNLSTPDNWQVGSAGYNESNALTSPLPKIAVNMSLNQAVMVWSKDGLGSNGVAMFDAPYNNWVGLPENDKTDYKIISVFPNPSSSFVTINFELNKSEVVNISLSNIDGRFIKTIANQIYNTGKHQVKIDVSALPPSTFIYTFKSSDLSTYGKLVVIR